MAFAGVVILAFLGEVTRDSLSKGVDDATNELDELKNQISDREKAILKAENGWKEALGEAQKKIAKLEQDLNSRTDVLDLHWIFQINFLAVDLEYRERFDLRVDSSGAAQWDQGMAENYSRGVQRVIGDFRVPYTANIGLDLRKVEVGFQKRLCAILAASPDGHPQS